MIFIKNRQEELCMYSVEKLFRRYIGESIETSNKQLNAQELINHTQC